MKTKSLFGLIVSLMAILFFCLSCNPIDQRIDENTPTPDKPVQEDGQEIDENTPTPDKLVQDDGQEIDENVRALDKLKQDSSHKETPTDDPPSISAVTIDGQPFVVTSRKYEMAAEFNEQLALDPTSDVIWVGALIDAETIPTGQYTPITAKRAPITISISLEHIDGNKSKKVVDPKLSTIREAIGEMLAQETTGATPAKITFMVEDVHSEEQLKIAVGSSYSDGFGSVKGQFDFSDEEIQTRLLVKFMQVYYTVDVDIPEKPSDFFDSSVKWDDLQSQISTNSSPMYISTITYGRMALFSFESSEESRDVAAAVSAAFGGYKGSMSTEYTEILKSSKIQATIFGGSGSSAVGAINGFEGIKGYILEGGNFDKDTAAAPLSYKMRYLKDNSIGGIILSSEYNILEHEPPIAFFQNTVDWKNAVTVSRLQRVEWDLFSDNIMKAEGDFESFTDTKTNHPLGSILTWKNVNDMGFGFTLKNTTTITPDASDDKLLGLVYADDEKGDPEFPLGTISIGDINNFENDNFEVIISGEEKEIYAIGFTIGNNEFAKTERVIVTCDVPNLGPIEQEFFLKDYSYKDDALSFIGVVSPYPLVRIFFDENADSDDIYVKDFKFGIPR